MTTNAELAGRLRSEAEKAEAQTGQPKEDFFWWDAADAITSLEAQLARSTDMLGDVPGATLEDKLTHYIGCYMALQIQLAEEQGWRHSYFQQRSELAEVKAQLASAMREAAHWKKLLPHGYEAGFPFTDDDKKA